MRIAGLLGFVAVVAASCPAVAQDRLDVADRLAVLDQQRNLLSISGVRQLDLINIRLDETHTRQADGDNVNSSSLAIHFNGADAPDAAAFDSGKHLAPVEDRLSDRIAHWVSGDVTVDDDRLNEPNQAGIFTNGVAFGTDARLGQDAMVGNAVGMAFDRTCVGSDGSMRSSFISDTIYGSLFTSPHTFVDIAAGASLTDFSSDFRDAAGAGRQTGRQVFASTRYSYRLTHRGLTFQPYGKARFSQSRFGGYADNSDGEPAYQSRDSHALDLTLGLQTETRYATTFGNIHPHANLELAHTFAELSGVSSITATPDQQMLAPASSQSDTLTFGAGVDLAVTRNMSVNADYGISSTATRFAPAHTVNAKFSMRF